MGVIMNLKEICQALIDGKKLHHMLWDKSQYVYLDPKSGGLVNESAKPDQYTYSFLDSKSWLIYEEPEDLDYKIESLITDIGFRLDGFADVEKQIALLIDLKIKQAKL